MLFTLLFASCKKNALISRREEASATRIMFVHAVPDGPQFNFFVNDVKITGAPATATGLIQGMAYNTANLPSYFGYSNITEGPAKIKAVVPSASTTITPGTVVLTLDQNLDKNKSYSVFTFDPFATMGGFITTDNLITDAQKAGIRFVNLMSGIPVDLEMTYTPSGSTTATTSLFATNVSYQGITDFKALPPGTYVFQRKRTGTNTLVGSATTITRLNAGQNFTLCARGTAAAMLQIPHQ